MASTTDNYNLPLYDTGDPANLRDQYNNAMGIIDGELKTLSDADSTTNATVAGFESKVTELETAVSDNESGIAAVNANLNALGANNVTNATNLKRSIAYTRYNTDFVTVCFGDSYCNGYIDGSGDNPNYEIVKYFAQAMDTGYKNYAVSGSGFSDSSTFNNQYNVARQDSTIDKNNVKFVLFCGGRNDNDSVIPLSTMSTFVNNVMDLYPNAVMIWCYGLWDAGRGTQFFTGNVRTNYCTAQNIQVSTSNFKRIIMAPHPCTWLLFKYDHAGTNHPNELGYKLIAQNLVSLACGGSIATNYNVFTESQTQYITPIADGISKLSCTMRTQDNIVSIALSLRADYTYITTGSEYMRPLLQIPSIQKGNLATLGPGWMNTDALTGGSQTRVSPFAVPVFFSHSGDSRPMGTAVVEIAAVPSMYSNPTGGYLSLQVRTTYDAMGL